MLRVEGEQKDHVSFSFTSITTQTGFVSLSALCFFPLSDLHALHGPVRRPGSQIQVSGCSLGGSGVRGARGLERLKNETVLGDWGLKGCGKAGLCP